ncbi:hypothetical protein LSCM1_04047 [Leishmania martiniquensis]|uniref:Fe2OG dioxygenase domain-containing protein n=1 Tax=Leishmania martiniquensis TaxID=1580590 RepID=A0A836KMU3_9TRYP|nr:hypothetical protein LSCM1_04047 [Leishmania martiniquensis]
MHICAHPDEHTGRKAFLRSVSAYRLSACFPSLRGDHRFVACLGVPRARGAAAAAVKRGCTCSVCCDHHTCLTWAHGLPLPALISTPLPLTTPLTPPVSLTASQVFSSTSMSAVHRTHFDLLPTLRLPRRQLVKVRLSCKKWLLRFLRSAASATGTEARDGSDFDALAASLLLPHAQATGFVVLNGGVLAGCTPYDLRQTLEAHGLLNFAAAAGPQEGSRAPCTPPAATPTPPPSRCVLHYGSALPFVVCSVPLQLRRDGVAEGDDEGASASSSSIFTDRMALVELTGAAASAAVASSSPSEAAAHDSVPNAGPLMDPSTASSPAVVCAEAHHASVEVVVLRVPLKASLWKGGSTSMSSSSESKGCGFLFMVPSDFAATLSRVSHLLQRPVIGIEPLLSSPLPVSSATAKMRRGASLHSVSTPSNASLSHEASPLERICMSRAVADVPGLFLVEDFVTVEEEKSIWQELYLRREKLTLEFFSRRRVAHFNRRFLYGVNALMAEGEMVNARPSFYAWMRARLQNDADAGGVRIHGEYPFRPGDYECDQLTVNYYDISEVGVCGIAAHVDAHSAFDDAVLIVSLGSYTVMEFARWDAPSEVAAPVGVCLAPRSLAVMTGESRYGWTHCIAERRTETLSELLPTFSRGDRLSLTWRRGRTQRHSKAECPYPALCDGD